MATLRTKTSLEDAIIAWIKLVHPTGKAILGRPSAPRPALPYITARIQGSKSFGFDDRSGLDADGVQTIYGDRVLDIPIGGYGTGSFDLLRALANSIHDQNVLSSLAAAGLSPQGHDDVVDLTEMLETEFEERAHVNMRFGIKDVRSSTIGWFEHVSLDGVVLRPDETEITVSVEADLTP